MAGKFGKPTVAVDGNVYDKVTSSPRARALLEEPTMPELSDLRRRFDSCIGDEELVLRAVMPQDQVDAMKAAGPARRTYNAAAKPIITLLEALSRERDLSHFSLQKPGFRLLLTR
jgi:oxaloacetate decarboxylase alpha subunit